MTQFKMGQKQHISTLPRPNSGRSLMHRAAIEEEWSNETVTIGEGGEVLILAVNLRMGSLKIDETCECDSSKY